MRKVSVLMIRFSSAGFGVSAGWGGAATSDCLSGAAMADAGFAVEISTGDDCIGGVSGVVEAIAMLFSEACGIWVAACIAGGFCSADG